MDRVWMGETNFDYDHVKLGSRPNATAIQVTVILTLASTLTLILTPAPR